MTEHTKCLPKIIFSRSGAVIEITNKQNLELAKFMLKQAKKELKSC